ncbi:efflux RND transporter permease subunit [Pseudanabaena sp. UWO310]|uniref:efflux RND transporter permease subunit n=1 Tax=Pseudanabaena sp. UWO310 TaxID=2480795 RepID=UPI00115B171F|nr:efflux RND transporter permease subunit [Pseudanabaena sp. UWO310]TYQ25505.1 efflux RND transporter permease subunit [Pseudanabaena sp. UWO310]
MNIQTFILRPVMTTLVMLAILLFGAISYQVLPVSDLPTVDFPTISVTAALPGASPETMASSVATPLERQFSSIAGLDSMTSSSAIGSTQITLQFSLNRQIDGAAADVQAAITKAAKQLPPTLPSPPQYSKVNPADLPILYIALKSEVLQLSEVNKYAENLLAQRLSTVDGVALVSVLGAQKYAVRIDLDPQALKAKGIGIDEVTTAIAQGNSKQATGSINGIDRTLTIGTNASLNNAKAYSSLIAAYRNGAPVRLNEIAQVRDSVENDKLAAWYNGTRGIILTIQRQPGTNTVAIVDTLKKLLPTFREQIPAAIDIEILYDRSQSVRASVEDVQFSLLLAIALVVMVIFLFLRNFSATLIPSIALPISLVATFAVMYKLGYSLDNLSLMALTLSVGFVVDDAVVVLENIVRHLEMGKSGFQAAIDGSKEIGFTVLSMTISLVAVFIPILFMGGIIGRLFQEFAVTISVAILASGFVSLTLTPMLCSRFLKHTTHSGKPIIVNIAESDRVDDHISTGIANEHHHDISNGHNHGNNNGNHNGHSDHNGHHHEYNHDEYNHNEHIHDSPSLENLGNQGDFFQRFYAWSLRYSLKYHRITMAISATILVATIILFGLVPKGFIPNDDTGQILGTTEAIQGISFDEMVKHQAKLAEIVSQDPDIEAVYSAVGAGGTIALPNNGRLFMRLKERSHRSRNVEQIIQDLRPKLSKTPGIRVFLQNPPAIRLGAQISKALYQYTVSDTDLEGLYRTAPELEAKLRQLDSLQDVTSDLQIKNPQVNIDIDRDRASALGITATQIESALSYAYSTAKVSTIYGTDNQYSVIVGLAPEYQADLKSLELLSVRSSSGQLVPLSTIASFKQTVSALSVNHASQLPAVTISFNLKPGISLSDVVGKIEQLAKEILPATSTGKFQGTAQAFQDSQKGLGLLLLAAILVIYIVLGILYESFIHPITILTSLPSAGFGALLTLLIFRSELNVYAFVGIILLVGIVKKNGIMMVDFAIGARKSGSTAYDAIYEACLVRFRPIMMTTMAALMGTLPIALGLGAGAESRRALGLAVVGGLVFSQMLTLYITPVFYVYMEAMQERWKNRNHKPSKPSQKSKPKPPLKVLPPTV